jgi:hypothetical protein
MSFQSTPLNTGNQAIIKTDISKIFLWNNRFEAAQYTNGGGAPVTLAEGTLLGRISATGKVIPLASAAADGSQFPVGILNEEKIVAPGATIDLFMCVSGDVDSSKVVLAGADTLDTVISGRRIRDRIGSDTVGIKLVAPADELTAYDNE